MDHAKNRLIVCPELRTDGPRALLWSREYLPEFGFRVKGLGFRVKGLEDLTELLRFVRIVELFTSDT